MKNLISKIVVKAKLSVCVCGGGGGGGYIFFFQIDKKMNSFKKMRLILAKI
jgi:hypothetical protein